MQFSPQQDKALVAVSDWIKNKDKPIFRLFGYAGTGKTTIAKHLVQDVKGTVLFAAFTGKAALVMSRNGMPASTLHSLIYRADMPSREQYEAISEKIKSASMEERSVLDHKMKEMRNPTFHLNVESRLKEASLLVVDEVSMVNEQLGCDVLSFNKPVLVLGDPGQLPPIKGTGYFVNDAPDIMLTEIHRQALDNPIIRLATDAREGKWLPLGTHGESRIISKDTLNQDDVINSDQIVAGFNKNRLAMNKRYRQLLAYETRYPQVGERLICLRNSAGKGLFNGLSVTTITDCEEFSNYLYCKIKPETGPDLEVKMHKAYFDAYYQQINFEDEPWWVKRSAEEFDYGYVITCHKAQGSQWDNVLIYDDGFAMNKPIMRKQWLYTAITRAAEKLTIVR